MKQNEKRDLLAEEYVAVKKAEGFTYDGDTVTQWSMDWAFKAGWDARDADFKILVEALKHYEKRFLDTVATKALEKVGIE